MGRRYRTPAGKGKAREGGGPGAAHAWGGSGDDGDAVVEVEEVHWGGLRGGLRTSSDAAGVGLAGRRVLTRSEDRRE